MATIKDVARLAGVNPSTVSRVFSGKAPVKKETCDRVLKIAQEIGFSFNRTARKLVLGQNSTKIIGVVVPNISHPFFMEILQGLTETFETVESCLMIFNLGAQHEQVYTRILEEGLSGLILLSVLGTPQFQTLLKAQRIPTVVIDYPAEDFPSVSVDHHLGGRLAAEYLITKGCKKPFYLGERFDSLQQKQRWQGFQNRWEEAGVTAIPQWKIQQGESTAQEAVRMILEREDWDGLFCYCDEMAYGAMRALREGKKNYPLVGYDDLTPSRYVGLSTIHQPGLEMGILGAKMLQDVMGGNFGLLEKKILIPELKIRGT